MKTLIATLVAGLLVVPNSGFAQSSIVEGDIFLELNQTKDTDQGTCQLVFKGVNGLNQRINGVTWRLAVVDSEGGFVNLLSLPLGDMNAGKTLFVQFNLQTPCNGLSEIIVNDVALCEINEQEGEKNVCLDNLRVSSRSETVGLGL